MINKMDHISVCICTYKRKELLARLIGLLQNQNTRNLFDYSILIVDNDEKKSAEKVIENIQKKSIIKIYYYNEPEQNIALARNKAVDNAKGNYIAFIDDDEFPIDDWLLKLYESRQKFNVDGVLGPVIPHYEVNPPKWVIKGRFFERPTHATGEVLTWKNTRTGNVLMKRAVFSNGENRFNKVFLTSEDREFFKRMIEKGRIFAWCNEAYVFETVPANRWKKSFMIKRALFRGKIASNYSDTGFKSLLKSVLAVFIYFMFLPVSLLIGQHMFMKYIIKLFDHLGKVISYFGIDFMKQKYVTE